MCDGEDILYPTASNKICIIELEWFMWDKEYEAENLMLIDTCGKIYSDQLYTIYFFSNTPNYENLLRPTTSLSTRTEIKSSIL